MIIVIEPQCFGFEHAEVNAALLFVIKRAFASEKILFFAELTHLNLVQEIAAKHNVPLIEYHSIVCPARNISNAQRLLPEWKLARQVFNYAEKLGCSRLIFASVTSPGLCCIKLLVRKHSLLSVIVIPHGILESIVKRPPLRPWDFPFWFRFSFLIGNSQQLQYLVFGESNSNELSNIFPQVRKYIQSIHLPYFFMDKQEQIKRIDSVIRFGAFGVGSRGKRTDLFFNIATNVHRQTSKETSEFILIGHITDPKIRKKTTTDVIMPSPDKPLSRDKYNEYAKKVDYAIFCFTAKTYKLTVSGSFFDALSYVKPIIAIKTPFFEYYFKQMGDIGYLCDSYADMLETIREIISKFPLIRYRQQVENIRKGRAIFEPEMLASRFRDIMGSLTEIVPRNEPNNT